MQFMVLFFGPLSTEFLAKIMQVRALNFLGPRTKL